VALCVFCGEKNIDAAKDIQKEMLANGPKKI
jgi:pentatricopeptide repeat protein